MTWQGRGLSGARWRAAPPSTIRGLRLAGLGQVYVRPAKRGHAPSVEIEYTLRLRSWLRFPQVRALSPTSLPAQRVNGSPVVKVPWLGQPDIRVQVVTEEPSMMAFGPIYAREVDRTPPCPDRTFGLYHRSFGEIAIASCATVGSFSETPIFAVRPLETELDQSFYSDLGELAARVREYYGSRLGAPPVPQAGILLFRSPKNVPHRSLGSYVALNVEDLLAGRDAKGTRARTLALLAHEYAHAWWAYGVAWDDWQILNIVNEALAVTLARRCVNTIGDDSAREQMSTELAVVYEYALCRSIRGLRRRGGSAAGIWPALLMILLPAVRREAMEAALTELWETGHREVLSLERCKAIVDRHMGKEFGSAFSDAIKDPRPIVARCHLEVSRGDSRWILNVKAPRSRRGHLVTRLRALVPGKGVWTLADDTHSIRFWGKTFEPWLSNLADGTQPCFVSSRKARAAAVNRWMLLGHLRAWSTERCLQVDRNRRLTLAVPVATACALLLNGDDPAGFLALAAMLEPVIPAASRRLRRAAAGRALQEQEAQIRQHLRE